MVAILVPADIHRHVHRFAPFLGLIGAGGSSAHRACEQDAVLKLGCDVIWSNSEVVATNRGHFARGSLSHFCARLSLSLSRVLPSSKSEHHATNSSLPLIHHLQALRTGSLGLVEHAECIGLVRRPLVSWLANTAAEGRDRHI